MSDVWPGQAEQAAAAPEAWPGEAESPKGVTVPDGIPAAMEARLEAGNEARKREGGLLQTIPQGIEMISTPEGRTKLWEGIKKYPSKFIDDTVNMAKLPGDVASGKIDLNTEEGLDQAIGLGMLVAGSRLNKLGQTGKTSGLSVNMGEPVSRISKGPMGEIYDLSIGTAARTEDFVHAAQVVAGEDAPMAVQQKVLRAYEEKGIHPSEMAHDAMSDPIVAQRLLSSEKADLPPGGPPPEPPAPPKPPPEPPKPPPEGSFEAAQKTILDKISVDGAAPKERMTWDKFYTQAVDDLHPLKEVDQGAYDLARLTRGQFGKAEHFLEHGTFDFHTYKTNGPALKDILAPVRDDLDGVRAFLASKRAVEIEAVGTGKVAENGLRIERSSDSFGERFNVVDQAGGEHYSVSVDTTSVPGVAGINWVENKSRAFSSLGPDIYRELARIYSAEGKKFVVGIQSTPSAQKVHARLERDGAVRRITPESITSDPEILKELKSPNENGAKRKLYEVIPKEGRKSGMDLEAANRVVAEGEGKYGKIAEEVVTYQRNALQYLRDSGVLSDEAFTAMTEAGKSYVPFYRMIGEGEMGGGGAGKSFGPGNPVKRLKGSERDIIDPLESIIKNTYAYVSIAERNAVGIKLIDALKADGAEVKVSKGRGKDPELVEYLKEKGVTDPEAIVDFVKSAIPEEGGDTLGAFRNGVKETVKVNDPELVTAFRGLEQSSANMLLKVLAVPAKALRTGAVLSPDFIVRNVVRDFMTAFVNSKGLFSPIDTAKGLVGVIRKDADFLDWLKGGGANSTMVALDRRYMQESLQKLNSETGLMERAWNVIRHPIDSSLRPLRVASELAENATRLGEFKKLVGEGGKENIQAAAMASREVTLDFARIGASMRAYNMITAFGNAQIQGLDRIGRQFSDRPTNTMLKVAGGITLPSVLLWWANKDDQRVKDLPAWQKDMFWIVATKDHLYRIPKPFELGVVFGSGVERILDATVGNNPEAFDKFSKSVMDIMLPNMMPTFAQPMVEQFANRSTFSDRTLIPQNMEKHLPEYQYTPYTTELSKKLGQVISAFPGMRASAVGPGAPFGPIARTVTSPILLENYIRAWTGGLGVYAMQAADAALRKTGALPDVAGPTPTLADIPVVKAFVVRYPSATTQSIQDFYDKHEVAKKFYDTWLSKAKEGDGDAVARIQAAGGPMMFVRLDAIKETLLDHNKLVRDIYKNPTIKPDEKRQLIDSLYFNMIEIGKAGKGMVTEAEKALGKAADAAP